MLVAFLLGTWLFMINCRHTRTAAPDPIDFMLVLSLCGIAGARILYIILFPQQFSSFADYLALHEGGLVFFGGLFTAALGLLLYLRRKKLPAAEIFDCLVPSLAFGHAIGRLGCLVNNCCYGVTTELIKIYHLPGDPANCYRHPTQFYESVFLVGIGLTAQLILRTGREARRMRPGILTTIYLATYSVWRFLVEFWRDDARGGFYTALHLSPSQLAAVVLMVTACLLMEYCYKYNCGSGDTTK
jgi:phosphatidylglycerol:prolipoprotein diacylglycerol transferase